MATAYEYEPDPLGERVNERNVNSILKDASKPTVVKLTSTQDILLSKENDDSFSQSPYGKIKDNLLKRSKSDKDTDGKKKEKSKGALFSGVFSRKKHHKSKGKPTSIIENDKYSKLDDSIEGPNAEKTKMGDTIFALTKKIEELEAELEDKKIEASIMRTESPDSLRQKIEDMRTETERLEMQNDVLEKEKDETEQNLKKALEKVDNLEATFAETETQRKSYQKRLIATQKVAQASYDHCIDELNGLIDENRLLLRKGLKGKPVEYKGILKVTDEYWKIKSENSRLFSECNNCIRRLTAKELEIDDLKRDLVSAVTALDQAGVAWKPITEPINYLSAEEEDLHSVGDVSEGNKEDKVDENTEVLQTL